MYHTGQTLPGSSVLLGGLWWSYSSLGFQVVQDSIFDETFITFWTLWRSTPRQTVHIPRGSELCHWFEENRYHSAPHVDTKMTCVTDIQLPAPFTLSSVDQLEYDIDTYVPVRPNTQDDSQGFWLGRIVNAQRQDGNIIKDLDLHLIEFYKGRDAFTGRFRGINVSKDGESNACVHCISIYSILLHFASLTAKHAYQR